MTALRHRVAGLAPALDSDSPRFRAAVLLLAALAAGLNIDRLARLTGYARHFVAACARRLHDNGIWESGETRYAWTEVEDPAFWNDVDVALGSLQRRTDEHGRPVWAPSGVWLKSYENVPGPPLEGQALVFHSAAPGEAPRSPQEPAPSRPAHPLDRAAAPTKPFDPPPDPGRDAWREYYASPRTPAAPAAESRVAELFPGASWLGAGGDCPGGGVR